MQEKIYKSIVYNMPYEYIADALLWPPPIL